MTSAFTITPTPPTFITVEAGKEATFSFTVTSLAAPDSARDVLLRALLAGADGQDKEVDWLVVGPQQSMRLAGGQTETITITAMPTETSPRGENTIKLVVASKQRPNDVFTESPPVTCEIVLHGPPPPPPPVRWRLIAVIAGGVVLLGAGAVLAWKLLQKPRLGEKCETASGCADGLLCEPTGLTCLRAPGAACTATDAGLCASRDCSTTNVCTIPTGSACDPDDTTAVGCARHVRCDRTTRTCSNGIVSRGTVVGPMAAAGPVVVLWVADDSLYKFSDGTATATTFMVAIPHDPPPAARWQTSSVDLSIGILALMPPGTSIPEGRLSTNKPANVGLSRRYAVIYRGPTDTGGVVAWTARFPVGLSCGRCVDSTTGHDSFEPVDCAMLVIDTDPAAPICNFD